MIQLRQGQSLRFDCTFYHQGGPYSGAKLHCVIGNQAITFDEILWEDSPVLNFPNYDQQPAPYQETVLVPVTKAISSGRYETYVKLMGIPGSDLFWYGPQDDIEILAEEAVFSNLNVVYQAA
jgi:hypothetical protein